MMKERELRPKEEVKVPRFTKSGSNIVAAGAGVNGFNPGPAKVTNHPENFYKSNRLSSKAQMHDFRPMKKVKSEFGFLGHKMTTSSRQMRMNSQNPH